MRRLPFVIVVSLSLFASCRSRTGDDGRGGSSGVDPVGFDKAALLRSFGECAVGTYRSFSDAATDLETKTRAAETDPSARDAARASWIAAMDIWQRAEVMQFGPIATSPAPGAQDMRDPIYAWPLVSRCFVNQQIVSKAYETPDFGMMTLVSGRSLGAVEYLLFHEGTDNGCPAENAINTGGTWAAIAPAELAQRKAAYARAAANDVATRARRLVDAWDPAKGNFVGTMATAGKNTTFASQQMAFNAVSDAMFYLDLQVKNAKIGAPAGLLPGCAAPPCLASVESPYAHRTKQNIRANLAAYTQLLRGCDAAAPGFDALLVAIGAEPVAQKLDGTVTNITVALDALAEPTFEEDLQKNPAGVKNLFDALRTNASTMKADFATVLDLELPKPALTDND